jgi:hypothetical protein
MVVKGPYNKQDWQTMSSLRRSINYLKDKEADRPKIRKHIRKEKEILSKYYSKEVA